MTSIMDPAAALDTVGILQPQTLAANSPHVQSRNRRLPGFDQMNSLKPSTTFGRGVGVGRHPWNTNGSIWGSSNRFTDGCMEEEAVSNEHNRQDLDSHFDRIADIRTSASREESNPPNKTGSSSLLLSSESEGPSPRSKVPWDATMSSGQSIRSRPQNDLISPTRTRVSDELPNGQTAHPNSAHRHLFTPSMFQNDTLNGSPDTQQGSRHVSNKLIQQYEKKPFPEFQPRNYTAQARTQVINSSYGAVENMSPKPASYRQSDHTTVGKSLTSYTNGAAHQTNGTVNGAYKSSSRTSAATFDPRYPLGYNLDQNGHNSQVSQPQPTKRKVAHEDFRKVSDTQLASNFNQMTLENGLFQWSNFSPTEPRVSAYYIESDGLTSGEMSKTGLGFSFDDRSHANITPGPPELPQDISHPFLSGAYYRTPSFSEQTTVSPSASDYRRSLQSPFYSTIGTPPTVPESTRSASGSGLSSRASNGHPAVLDRKLRNLEPYSRDQYYPNHNPLQTHASYPPPPYDYATYTSNMRMNPLASPYTVSGYVNPIVNPQASRYPFREQDASHIIRSPLLEDFRTNSKTNKRHELKDIYNHVVEFSGDQHGSRFIQQKLETANSDEKDQIFTEILPDSLQLMTDVFGNYVVQKLFEHGNQSQKKLLANQMKGHVLSLSLQMYGCRVVQKALEHILTDQQASMVKELESHVMKCVKDQNGNHVIQKAIERVPAEHIQFIVDAFHDQIQRLATHPYGCRVIQRMLEHCERPAKLDILRELHQCVSTLISDQFGNYVIQHVIERGEQADRSRVVSVVQASLLMYSKHKFASNVVEKSLEFAEESQRQDLLNQLTVTNERGEGPVFGLMRDQYGNYVIQKVVYQLQGLRRQAVVDQIKTHLPLLKKFSYGKQIAAMEKLVADYDNRSLSASSQSSTLPSTNVSTSTSIIDERSTPYQAHMIKSPPPYGSQIEIPLTPSQPRAP